MVHRWIHVCMEGVKLEHDADSPQSCRYHHTHTSITAFVHVGQNRNFVIRGLSRQVRWAAEQLCPERAAAHTCSHFQGPLRAPVVAPSSSGFPSITRSVAVGHCGPCDRWAPLQSARNFKFCWAPCQRTPLDRSISCDDVIGTLRSGGSRCPCHDTPTDRCRGWPARRAFQPGKSLALRVIPHQNPYSATQKITCIHIRRGAPGAPHLIPTTADGNGASKRPKRRKKHWSATHAMFCRAATCGVET